MTFQIFFFFMMQSYFYLLDYMITDFKATGKCSLQLTRESFWPVQITWGLPKDSSYIEMINRGYMKDC